MGTGFGGPGIAMGDALAHHGQVEIIEQQKVGARSQCLIELGDRFHFHLNKAAAVSILLCHGLGGLHSGGDAAGG